MLLQLLPVGAIAYKRQSRIGQRLEHRTDPFDLFFCGETTDIQQKCSAVVVCTEQALTEFWATQLGPEHLCIDAPLP